MLRAKDALTFQQLDLDLDLSYSARAFWCSSRAAPRCPLAERRRSADFPGACEACFPACLARRLQLRQPHPDISRPPERGRRQFELELSQSTADENRGNYRRGGQYDGEDGCTFSEADGVYEETCSDGDDSSRYVSADIEN